jgi:hypothetical protein
LLPLGPLIPLLKERIVPPSASGTALALMEFARLLEAGMPREA